MTVEARAKITAEQTSGFSMEFIARDGSKIEEPLEGIAPILKATTQGFEIIGTAFFVTSCGIMFTAAHVASQWQLGADLVVIHKEFEGSAYVVRNVIQAILHRTADVALLRLDLVQSKTTEKIVRCRTVSVSIDVPPIQSRVGCWGYPQSSLLPPGPQYDGFTVLLERGRAEGLIEEHFPNGRDRIMQPGECIQTSMNTLGGASGGPVFNEHGKAFAVVSSGFEDTTYVAPVKDLALAKIYRAEGPSGDETPISLLEYVARY